MKRVVILVFVVLMLCINGINVSIKTEPKWGKIGEYEDVISGNVGTIYDTDYMKKTDKPERAYAVYIYGNLTDGGGGYDFMIWAKYQYSGTWYDMKYADISVVKGGSIVSMTYKYQYFSEEKRMVMSTESETINIEMEGNVSFEFYFSYKDVIIGNRDFIWWLRVSNGTTDYEIVVDIDDNRDDMRQIIVFNWAAEDTHVQYVILYGENWWNEHHIIKTAVIDGDLRVISYEWRRPKLEDIYDNVLYYDSWEIYEESEEEWEFSTFNYTFKILGIRSKKNAYYYNNIEPIKGNWWVGEPMRWAVNSIINGFWNVMNYVAFGMILALNGVWYILLNIFIILNNTVWKWIVYGFLVVFDGISVIAQAVLEYMMNLLGYLIELLMRIVAGLLALMFSAFLFILSGGTIDYFETVKSVNDALLKVFDVIGETINIAVSNVGYILGYMTIYSTLLITAKIKLEYVKSYGNMKRINQLKAVYEHLAMPISIIIVLIDYVKKAIKWW